MFIQWHSMAFSLIIVFSYCRVIAIEKGDVKLSCIPQGRVKFVRLKSQFCLVKLHDEKCGTQPLRSFSEPKHCKHCEDSFTSLVFFHIILAQGPCHLQCHLIETATCRCSLMSSNVASKVSVDSSFFKDFVWVCSGECCLTLSRYDLDY